MNQFVDNLAAFVAAIFCPSFATALGNGSAKRRRRSTVVAATLISALTLTFSAQFAAAEQPNSAAKPTLWIVGDSTVRNGTKDQRGWGDEIAPFFDTDRINIANKARGGRSSRTYQTEGLWDEVLKEMKAGDFVMIQFGHNDGGPLDDEHRARGSIRGTGDESKDIYNPIMKKDETVHTFGWYMSKYIADTRAKGATPIVLSYVPRCPKPGSPIDADAPLTSYALWAREVAEREDAPFIDLYGISMRAYASLPAEEVKAKYFAPDNTHTNPEGAKLNAESVVKGLRAIEAFPLTDYLKDGAATQASASASASAALDKPQLHWSKTLPEGNYTVTVVLGHDDRAATTTIKAESRQLVLDRVRTAPGESDTRRFTVNVRTPSLPAGDSVRLKSREQGIARWDDQLTLEVAGDQSAVRSIDVAPAPEAITIYLAGDSTVTDQSTEPYAGWGQMLPAFFDANVAVANHAESGETLRAFRAEKRLDKILSKITARDYLFIQFGHNDMKEQGDGIGAFTSFKADLEDFVARGRARGATVVLVTPPHRRFFDRDGTLQNTHGDYPEAIRQVASEQGVPLVDLHAMSKTLFEALGPSDSTKAFVHYPAGTFPGQSKSLKDETHFNNYGAYQLARCVVHGIQKAELPLASHIVESFGSFDPARPEPAADFDLPASAHTAPTTPAGN